LRLDEASQIRTAIRVEAEREADEVTKQAVDKANEMVATARRKGMAIVDAGRKEARALVDDAPKRMADLDTEHRELTHRLGVMETIYRELVATLKLVAEISTEELVETQDPLRQLDLRETEQPPTRPKGEQTTGSAPQDELPESAPAQAGPPIQEAQEEADQLVHEARGEASREPSPDSVPEADDDGREELAVIIDDRDLKQRRSRYERWLNLNRENRAPREDATLKRFSRVLSSTNSVEGADPEEVEARIRNLTHGTNGD
jgi:vacuolar-type H+-ATPase subunit H